MRNTFDPLAIHKHLEGDEKLEGNVIKIPSPSMPAMAERGRYEPIPGADIPYFNQPVLFQGTRLLTFEDAFKDLIATGDSTILLPENDPRITPGWYCNVIKNTAPVGETVVFEPETPNVEIYSIDDSKEILEVNGMVTIKYVDVGRWYLIGGLA